MMIKKLSIVCSVGLIAFLAPQILNAGGIKEKVQRKLNAPSNLQFNNDLINQQEGDNEPCDVLVEENISVKERESQSLRRLQPAIPIQSSYAIYKTDYKAQIEEDVVTVSGKVLLEVFKKGWTQLPLVKNNVGLIDVSINRSASFVISQGSMYYLMIDKPGRYNLDIEFLIKAARERENGPGNFSFDIMSSPISQFEFTIPETGVEIFVEPAIKTEVKKEAKQTVAWAVLPNTNSITVRWTKALPKETITKVKLEPKLFVDTATYVSVGEGIVRCQANLNYSILQSEVSNLRVALPEDVSILEVKAKDLRDWKTSVKDGLQYLDVYLNFGVKGNYVLNLNYERKIGEASGIVEIPWTRAVGVEREKGYFGLAAATNVELQVNKIEHVSLIDVKELPGSIWSSSTSPLLLAFKYLNQPFNISIDVTKHQEVPVLVAAIDYADYTSLQTDEGKNLTKAVYQIRNNVKQFLRLSLPKGTTLWSAFVAGRAVKPAADKNGSILIPLEKSQFEREDLTQFPVEIVYLNDLPKMGWLGSLKLVLPKTDIPVSNLSWSLYLPLDYIYFNLGGDVKQTKSGLYDKLYTRARKLETAKGKMDYSVAHSQMAEDYKSIMEQKASTLGVGALPIKIDVPTQGKLYRFSKLLVTEKESPWVSMAYLYCFRQLQWLVWILIFTGIIVLIRMSIKKIVKIKKSV